MFGCLSSFCAGFLEFKDVEIQCQHDGELLVKVCMSDHCKGGRFWATLQNACIPVMELIDWELSRPSHVADIFCSYGIDSAWKYFVEVCAPVFVAIGFRFHLMKIYKPGCLLSLHL
jgi:DNA-directed RNA polymerase-4 subunit 1